MAPPPRWRRHRTRHGPPRWGNAPRGRRVLIEHADPGMREALTRRLQEHGYRVVTCAGPSGADPAVACPVLRDEACPAVDGADAVVVALDPGEDVSAQLVQRLNAARPHLPVIADSGLHVTAPQVGEAGSHRFYRTSIAPLVRRLYDVLLLNRAS